MACCTLQLDLGLICPVLPPLCTLGRRTFTFVHGSPRNGELHTLGSRAAQSCSGNEDNLTPDGLQEFLWRKFFSDPAQWWDNRRRKRTLRHPDFRHKKSKDALWLNDWYKPAWVDLQLAKWDAEIRIPPASQKPCDKSVTYEDLDIARCRKVCEDGQVTEAVDALNYLVQRAYHVPYNIFYHVLKRCIAHKDLVQGRRVHTLTVQSGYEGNAFLTTHLIGLYASHGRLEEAMQVFSKVQTPDVYNWVSLIFAYARHGEPTQALELYQQMCDSSIKPSNRTFVAGLQACATARNLAAGKDVHKHILASAGKPDMFVQTCLVDMYAKCGSLEDARGVFDRLSQKNVVTWTAMIAGYAQQGLGDEALSLYSGMQEEGISAPNSVTFVCLLQACASVGGAALYQGKQLHSQIEERGLNDDVVVGSSLVNMYAKCGSVENARRVFDRLPQKNVVTWSAMIAGYAQQGQGEEALEMYSSVQQEDIMNPPDPITFVCLLQACASAVALPLGKQLHAQIKERGWQADPIVGPSLVNMYAKCGSMADSQQVFDSLPERQISAWGALIAGYSQQGNSQVVFELLDRMKLEGIQPDDITFLSAMSVCSHVGLVVKGRKLFESMITDHGISPGIEHYVCMMDLLGRAGHLEEALQMAKTMPIRPSAAVWLTLLGACRKWSNVAVGQQAFEFAVALNKKDASAYVLMSNIYAGAEMWEEANEMQTRRVKNGAMKDPGQSWWNDKGGAVHTFLVG